MQTTNSNRLLSMLLLRQVLIVVATVLLALLAWLVGPLVSFDGLHPLASVSTRVIVIVLVVAAGILGLLRGPFHLVGVAALCLLIWHGGPLLSVGPATPLARWGVRAAIIALVLGLCAIYWLFRLYRTLQNDQDFRNKFLTWGKTQDKEAKAKEHIQGLDEVVNAALRQLRNLRGHGGMRRVVEGKRYLYELPWYMLIGGPGAGKTTALLNSGLQFPLGRPGHGAGPESPALQAGAGTVGSNWWFTNEAVIIDTAGRYTRHDADANAPLEWNGFLGLLRRHRTGAPVNGVIVALGTDELLRMQPGELVERGAGVRERLLQLRERLGIQFPVYVLVTKADRLKGFEEYFQSLTSEARSQVWGFTLPLDGRRKTSPSAMAEAREALRTRIHGELALLRQRLDAGLRGRLLEEYDGERRRRLFALPQELGGLSARVEQMVDEIFLDSRFDTTQARNPLRGIYFTSAAQLGADIAADPYTVLHRLTGQPDADQDSRKSPSRQGYFLRDVFARVIIPEAHLVRPNLRWEWRFLFMRTLGHLLVVLLFGWCAGSLALSFANNGKYLAAVREHASRLEQQVRELSAQFRPIEVPGVLSAARALPAYPGLVLADPPASYRWGLYTAPPVIDEAQEAYAGLQDRLLLPAILRRMEEVLVQSVRERDTNTAYEALRAYKLLHDSRRFRAGGAQEVREWVLGDWRAHPEAAEPLGGSAALLGHVELLFSGRRDVQAAGLANEALVRQVQDFLDADTSSQRIYDRAKAAMAPQAPPGFSLISAVGHQAGTVFARANGAPLEQGVPGLFTYDGYHQLFNKRLSEFAGKALLDDAWVMGRTSASVQAPTSAALQDIRRRYLQEYAQRWADFLDSVRLVGASDLVAGSAPGRAVPASLQALGTATTSTNLGFELAVLRQLAAPDSPLARLGRAAARETTLSRPLGQDSPKPESGLLDKAVQAIDRARSIGSDLGIRPEQVVEKELVDNRFAALREVVTGQADAAGSIAGDAGKPGLAGVLGQINEFYTVLVVADTALNANALPPAGIEAGARLKLEADKLPAPFRSILSAIAAQGMDEMARGSASILRSQARQQLDRIMGLMASQVSDDCKRGIEGRYPFADAAQDALPDDVTQVFAAGGAMDGFFVKYLAPFVDTSVRPWRYKNPDDPQAMLTPEALANMAPSPATPTGPSLVGELLRLLAQSGPDLESFSRARQIRESLFRAANGKALGWKVDMQVLALDPSATELIIDIDGQGQRYVHGPVQAFSVSWPGPQGGGRALLAANPRISTDSSTIVAQGPWALLRLFDQGQPVSTSTPAHTHLEYSFDGRKALLDVSTGSHPNTLNSSIFKGFRCPGRAA